MVRATDPAGVPQVLNADVMNSDMVTVNITVTDVNEPPNVTGKAAVPFKEATGNIEEMLDTYAADNPEDVEGLHLVGGRTRRR